MPYDGTTFVSSTITSVKDLGLTPIEPYRVKVWRRHVTDRFAKGFLFGEMHHHRAHLLSTGIARWATCPVVLAEFGDYFHRAPAPVRRLARQISNAIPGVMAEVHYFDTDPILYVKFDNRRECVAIWDRGIVRAIAEGAPKLSLRQRILRQVVMTV